MKITSAKLKTLLAAGVDAAMGKRGFMTAANHISLIVGMDTSPAVLTETVWSLAQEKNLV